MIAASPPRTADLRQHLTALLLLDFKVKLDQNHREKPRFRKFDSGKLELTGTDGEDESSALRKRDDQGSHSRKDSTVLHKALGCLHSFLERSKRCGIWSFAGERKNVVQSREVSNVEHGKFNVGKLERNPNFKILEDISFSVFVTNFPHSTILKNLWRVCEDCGAVSKSEKRFAFDRFLGVGDSGRLIR
ncbi:hypothetical protein L1987_15908 [Smallanthus sonchifolius]|uniref:Uncharacterized protein n=1 Tax=Smallanthus sonchifolius TaxID=185202 RepID=A0ACB9J786_9ASTR|nr:hypothetical protein L1987_15908 [Smallanthus sonchifolius]